MTDHPYLTIADQLRDEIRRRPAMTDLPCVADLMAQHSVSRGVVLHALAVLRREGLVEPLPGGRWNVAP